MSESRITWTPKMCEQCREQPAIWHHTDSVSAKPPSEQAQMMLCDDCSYGVGGDYTVWTGSKTFIVEALWKLHCMPALSTTTATSTPSAKQGD